MNVVAKCRCGWQGTFDDTQAGQAVRCGACGAELQLPELPAPSVAVGSAPVNVPVIVAAAPAASPKPTPIARLKSLLAAVIAQITRVLRPVWNFVRDAFDFYWRNRETLRSGWRLWITDYLPALDQPEDIRREIRLPLEDQDGLRDVAGVWHVDLPARCVYCAGVAKGDWIEEPRTLLDPYRLIAAPLAGLAAGLILGWWYHSLIWLIAAPFAGVVIGYAIRRNEDFLLRFKRCARHADEHRIPELALLHRRMVLRLGSRDAKLAYLRAGNAAPPIDEMVPERGPEFEPPPETIALADSIGPDRVIVPDTERRLPAADDAPADADPHAQPLATPSETRLPPRPAAHVNETYGVEGYDGQGNTKNPKQSLP